MGGGSTPVISCRRDDEGFVFVVDRKKDMIISGGENIYSTEIEDVLDAHPKVREVAVIGVPHPRWVETPLAVIVPSDPDDPPTEDDVAAWCRERLASYKKPSAIRIVDALPRNVSGKVLKTDLRRRFGGEVAAGRDAVGVGAPALAYWVARSTREDGTGRWDPSRSDDSTTTRRRTVGESSARPFRPGWMGPAGWKPMANPGVP